MREARERVRVVVMIRVGKDVGVVATAVERAGVRYYLENAFCARVFPMGFAFVFGFSAIVLGLCVVKIEIMDGLSPTCDAIRDRSNVRECKYNGFRAGILLVGATRNGIKRDEFCVIVMKGGLQLVCRFNVVA